MRPAVWLILAVFTSRPARLFAAEEPGPSARVKSLRAAAREAYQAKRYADACRDYGEVTRLAPAEASAWTDLGVCLARLGRRAEAISANRRAIVVSAPAAQDGEGAKVRRNAYFNLGKLGEVIRMPPRGCSRLPGAPGCPARLWACTVQRQDASPQLRMRWTAGRIGLSREDASIDRFSERPRMPALEADPAPPEHGEGGAPPGRAVDVLLGARTEATCHCDGEDSAWRCDQSEAVRSRAAEVCPRTDAADRDDRCYEKVCREARDDPWPAVSQEQTRASEICARDCAALGRSTITCAVVTADACLGVVGVTCTVAPIDPKEPRRTTVDELLLERQSAR